MAPEEWFPPPPDWAGRPAETFDTLRTEVLELKSKGILGLPALLAKNQIRVLEENLGRLPAADGAHDFRRAARAILDDICRPRAHPRQFPYWEPYAAMLGLAGRPNAAKERSAQRHCVIAQALSMSPWAWPDPARGILYAGLQHALHKSFERYDTREYFITEDFIREIGITFQFRIMDPLKSALSVIQGLGKMQFATASMQGQRDYLAADLAIVIGQRIFTKDVFRVVLIQAKKQDKEGRFRLRTPESTAQLGKFLSSGMGWFAFYPRIQGNRQFIVTARPATDVFEDVWQRSPPFVAEEEFASGGSGEAAWDLPTWISTELTLPRLTPGRIFPDAASVAAALSVERAVPLVEGVIVADLTGTLDLMEFKVSMAAAGYRIDETTSLEPVRRDPRRAGGRRSGSKPPPSRRG